MCLPATLSEHKTPVIAISELVTTGIRRKYITAVAASATVGIGIGLNILSSPSLAEQASTKPYDLPTPPVKKMVLIIKSLIIG